MTHMQLLTDGSFLGLHLFLLSRSLLHFEPFHLLLALFQLVLQRGDIGLVITVIICNQINSARLYYYHRFMAIIHDNLGTPS